MSDIVVQKGVVNAAANGSKFLKSVVKKHTGLKTKRGSAMQIDGGGSSKKALSKAGTAKQTPEERAAAQAARIAKWAAKNAKKKQARKLFKLNAPAKMQVEATPAAVVSPQPVAKAGPPVKKPQERKPAWPAKVKKAKKTEVGKEALRAKGVAAAKVAAAVAAARANAGAAAAAVATTAVPSGAAPASADATAAATPTPGGVKAAAAATAAVPAPKAAAPVWGAAAPGKELTKAERRKQNQRAFKLQRIAFAKTQNGGGRCSGGSGKR